MKLVLIGKNNPHTNQPTNRVKCTIFLHKDLRPKKRENPPFKLVLEWRSFHPRPHSMEGTELQHWGGGDFICIINEQNYCLYYYYYNQQVNTGGDQHSHKNLEDRTTKETKPACPKPHLPLGRKSCLLLISQKEAAPSASIGGCGPPLGEPPFVSKASPLFASG